MLASDAGIPASWKVAFLVMRWWLGMEDCVDFLHCVPGVLFCFIFH